MTFQLLASGGHLLFNTAFDNNRDRFWRSTMHTDAHKHVKARPSCQHRKSRHRPPEFPVGHSSITRTFQCVVADLVEYKFSPGGNRYILSVMSTTLTRFVFRAAIRNEEASTIARNLVERVFSVFGPRDTLHSDQGSEFENQLHSVVVK